MEKKNEILYWRVGIGLAIILIIAGLVYFISKGINWGIQKVGGQGQVAIHTSELYSNADPLSSHPTEPVISDMNIIPVGSGSGQVLGASTQAPASSANSTSANNARLSNNCPAYESPSYYYCEWIDDHIYRPFNSKAEFDAAHN